MASWKQSAVLCTQWSVKCQVTIAVCARRHGSHANTSMRQNVQDINSASFVFRGRSLEAHLPLGCTNTASTWSTRPCGRAPGPRPLASRRNLRLVAGGSEQPIFVFASGVPRGCWWGLPLSHILLVAGGLWCTRCRIVCSLSSWEKLEARHRKSPRSSAAFTVVRTSRVTEKTENIGMTGCLHGKQTRQF